MSYSVVYLVCVVVVCWYVFSSVCIGLCRFLCVVCVVSFKYLKQSCYLKKCVCRYAYFVVCVCMCVCVCVFVCVIDDDDDVVCVCVCVCLCVCVCVWS
jgi:hypothetical protein